MRPSNSKAIVDITLRPRCALPSPASWPITLFPADRPHCMRSEFCPDSYLRLPGILSDPFCCMTLLAIEISLLQRTRYSALSMGRKTPKLPLPLGISSHFRRRTEPRP